MAADAVSGDRRHIPSWNGNAAKWEPFRDEIRVWRLGENLNVKYTAWLPGLSLGCQVLRHCHGR